jgi:phosphoglycolate phosphatase
MMATLRTRTGTLNLAAVATDLDRTITDPELAPVPAALDALARLSRHGVRTILCTGRSQAELPESLPRGVFDALVLEGGAVAGLPGDVKPLAVPPGWPSQVEAWLTRRGIAYLQGEAYLSILADHVGDAEELAREVPVTYKLNRDRVDLTPPGVDKGAGLRHALGLLGVTGPVLAFGDADNDVPLLQAATYKVAVENAVEPLRRIADELTTGFGGAGVAAFLRERVSVGNGRPPGPRPPGPGATGRPSTRPSPGSPSRPQA